jgi:hypothetical protein
MSVRFFSRHCTRRPNIAVDAASNESRPAVGVNASESRRPVTPISEPTVVAHSLKHKLSAITRRNEFPADSGFPYHESRHALRIFKPLWAYSERNGRYRPMAPKSTRTRGPKGRKWNWSYTGMTPKMDVPLASYPSTESSSVTRLSDRFQESSRYFTWTLARDLAEGRNCVVFPVCHARLHAACRTRSDRDVAPRRYAPVDCGSELQSWKRVAEVWL